MGIERERCKPNAISLSSDTVDPTRIIYAKLSKKKAYIPPVVMLSIIRKRKHLALTIKRKIKRGVEPLVEDKRQNAFSKPCSDYSPTNSIGTNCMGKKVKPLHR